MKTSEILAKLKKLSGQVGELLFERAGLALEALNDKAWVAETYAGNRDRAVEVLGEDCFPDMVSTNWFDRMLVLRGFYAIETWKEMKWSLPRLWGKYEEDRKAAGNPEPPRSRRSQPTRKELEQLADEKQSLAYQLRRQKETSEDWQLRYRDLEAKYNELKVELAELRGENKMLRAQLGSAPRSAVA